MDIYIYKYVAQDHIVVHASDSYIDAELDDSTTYTYKHGSNW